MCKSDGVMAMIVVWKEPTTCTCIAFSAFADVCDSPLLCRRFLSPVTAWLLFDAVCPHDFQSQNSFSKAL